MNENDLFEGLTEEELALLLGDTQTDIDKATKNNILKRAEKKAAISKELEFPYKRIAYIAASLCVVLVAALIYVLFQGGNAPQTAETTPTTTESRPTNPLLLALKSDDEELIKSLLNYSDFIDTSVLDYAVSCAGKVSYGTVQLIASRVKETFGSTGLSPLLECAVLGDSEGELAELEKCSSLSMNLEETLAYFFSAAFCDDDVIERFVELGVSTMMRDPVGKTMLDIAEAYENQSIIEYAEENGLYT